MLGAHEKVRENRRTNIKIRLSEVIKRTASRGAASVSNKTCRGTLLIRAGDVLRIRLRINIPTDWPDETDSAATLTPTLKFPRESGYVPAQTRKNNRRSVNIVRGLAAAVFSYPFQIGFSILSSPSRPYPANGFPSVARLPLENRSLGDSLNTPTARDLPGAGRLIGETLPGRFLATHRSSLAAGQGLFFGPDFVDFQRRQPTTT